MDIITIGGGNELINGDLIRAVSEQLNNTPFTETWQKTLAISLCKLLEDDCTNETTIDNILNNATIGYWTRVEFYIDNSLTVYVSYIKDRDVTLAEYLQKSYNSIPFTLGNILQNRTTYKNRTVVTYNHYFKIPQNQIIKLEDKRKI